MVEKLTRVRPVSLGQAGRIPGVTPAAIAILRMHLRRGRIERERRRTEPMHADREFSVHRFTLMMTATSPSS